MPRRFLAKWRARPRGRFLLTETPDGWVLETQRRPRLLWQTTRRAPAMPLQSALLLLAQSWATTTRDRKGHVVPRSVRRRFARGIVQRLVH